MTDVFGAPGVHWTPVSWQLRVMRRLGVLWAVDLALVAWAVAVSLLPALEPWRVEVAATVLVLGVLAWWLVGRGARAWAYAEEEDDLYIKRGTLVRHVIAVPYGRMQFVEVTAGPLQQAFRLATVRLNTASPRSRGRIVGVTPREAARLRDRLTELGQTRSSGL
ncbi:PH domain-containing protein [Nocardioidaceae bacterium]|nr:PH domain-containing protein [Nocardioidaceae bacterium]